MQDGPRTNAERRLATRGALVAAARELFAEKGYAGTGTPEIVAAAEVTRGALYHHFEDKAALFEAVAEAEAAAVAGEIAAVDGADPVAALVAGARAYFAAMARPGRVRILLLDGPVVLGHARMAGIDGGTGARELRAGLAAVAPGLGAAELDALAVVLSAGFDRAALEIAGGAEAAPLEAALERVLRGLAGA